ncbi:archease [Pontibacter chinhatensis]|uniref:Archease protein family (MTH1598/TM1083) n=1 Tax=Pontibacter chinhatensis TaxID=1436961 RepID=A0A1I2XQH0_9BACT|nr:archease [Pontibacter chinhatensis]SFH15289.1 Archease protein family (MTH1598/TM1083) [Pontibacter chinhatensis]
MNKLTYLPQAANKCLKVEADTPEELFLGTLQGMANLLKEGSCGGDIPSQLIHKISICSADFTSLLMDFLCQTLNLSQSYSAVFCKLSIDQLETTSIDGCLYGHYVEEFIHEIKSIESPEGTVQQPETGTWETALVFGI